MPWNNWKTPDTDIHTMTEISHHRLQWYWNTNQWSHQWTDISLYYTFHTYNVDYIRRTICILNQLEFQWLFTPFNSFLINYIHTFNYLLIIVVVVSGMQLLRLRSPIRRHHPPQRAILSQICCFGECKVVLFQILLDGAEPRDVGTSWLTSPVCRRGG